MRNWGSSFSTYVWSKYLLFHNKFNNGKLSSLSFISELSLSFRHSSRCLIIIISRFLQMKRWCAFICTSLPPTPLQVEWWGGKCDKPGVGEIEWTFVIQLYCHLIIWSLDLTNRSRVLLNNSMAIILLEALQCYVGVNIYNILSHSLRIS